MSKTIKPTDATNSVSVAEATARGKDVMAANVGWTDEAREAALLSKRAHAKTQQAHTELSHMAARTAHLDAATAHSKVVYSMHDEASPTDANFNHVMQHSQEAADHVAQAKVHANVAANFSQARFNARQSGIGGAMRPASDWGKW